MMTRSHSLRVDLPVPPDVVFAALHTPSAIRQWWGAARAVVLPGAGGSWTAAWGPHEDAPDHVTTATIDLFDPPRRLRLTNIRYYARSGALPFEPHLLIEFSILPVPDGCVLQVRHAGFPVETIADDFYAACERGWRETLAGLQRYFQAVTV
jgi:uncharacterized protein YndB with AHSA1/START domain